MTQDKMPDNPEIPDEATVSPTAELEKRISRQVKRLRKQRYEVDGDTRFTQDQVANYLHVERSTLANKENGRYPFFAHEIVLLSQKFEVPYEYFFGDSDDSEDMRPISSRRRVGRATLREKETANVEGDGSQMLRTASPDLMLQVLQEMQNSLQAIEKRLPLLPSTGETLPHQPHSHQEEQEASAPH